MKSFSSISLLLTAGFLVSAEADWRQFRGPNGSGYANGQTLPTALDAEKNIQWKVALPGRGLSSPIVVGDQVFITASSGANQDRLHVFCFSSKDGSKVWERQFWSTGRTMCHSKTNVAAPTPVTDGKHVLALFSCNDLVCLDLEGNLQWLRGLTSDYPNASNSLGLASSPIIAEDTLIVQIENDSDSFAAGIELKHGVNLWRKPRPKSANWTSPIVVRDSEGNEFAALQSSRGLDVVDPKSGEVAWSFRQGASTIPSSAQRGDVIYVPSNGLTAIRPGQGGEAEEVWQSKELRPGTASPLVVGDHVYVINNSGVLNCGHVSDGKRLWRVRLKGPFGGTPVATEQHLYVVNEAGLLQVVELGESEGKVVSTLELGEMVQCAAAVSGNALFVRSDKHLWKIGS